jgi:hypothetical protein
MSDGDRIAALEKAIGKVLRALLGTQKELPPIDFYENSDGVWEMASE